MNDTPKQTPRGHHAAEVLGRAIADGTPPVGGTFTIVEAIRRTGTGKSSTREGLLALQAKGVVSLKKSTGITVQPVGRWSLLDPDVARWASGTVAAKQVAYDAMVVRDALAGIDGNNVLVRQIRDAVAVLLYGGARNEEDGLPAQVGTGGNNG